jgi:hypothetical protein
MDKDCDVGTTNNMCAQQIMNLPIPLHAIWLIQIKSGFFRGGRPIICAQGSNLKVDNIYPRTQ